MRRTDPPGLIVRWRTSSYSGANGDCVEVAGLPDGCWAVRDTKDRTRPPLTFSPAAWSAFLGAVRDRAERLNPPSGQGGANSGPRSM